MNKLIYICIVIISLIITSCFPEDIPLTPRNKGNSSIKQVEMTKFYSYQIYFNLNKDTIIKQNHLTEWDLGFECDLNSFHIVLNHSKIMSVAHTNKFNFDEVTKIDSLKFIYEGSEGNLDSTAIGKWWLDNNNIIKSKNEVIIVNRGTSDKSRQIGYKKMQILDYITSYQIKYSNLDGSELNELNIPKNVNLNYQTISFDGNGSIVNIEPYSNEWDIVFTRYTQFFNEVGYETYSVVGVFINPRYVSVYADSTGNIKFDDIKISDVANKIFSSKRDAIGYDWKKYKFDAESYAIDPKKIYIIKINKNNNIQYYKLRFTDFYKEINGRLEKGYPKFEYLPL